MITHQVRRWCNISRRKSSGNDEDTFFELCCAGPNRFKAVKNAAHSPGSFSQPEFLEKGAEPQTVEQCALHAVAATLVPEFGVPHDAREDAGFDSLLGCVGADVPLGASATPSRCVLKCGQRDSDQTADVDGEFHERDSDCASGVCGAQQVASFAGGRGSEDHAHGFPSGALPLRVVCCCRCFWIGARTLCSTGFLLCSRTGS